MAIYARCCNCRKDNPKASKKCNRCNEKLGGKYLVKVKDSSTGKWRAKITPSLKVAKKIESKLKVQQIEGKLFDKKQKDTFSFEKYLAHAKLNKKTWKDDEQRWNKHIAGSNWKSRQGILAILNKMKKAGYQPATIHHVLKLIRRVYNWHIQNNLFHSPNPTDTIILPKYDNRKNNILSKQQIEILEVYLTTWENRRAALVTMFALYTGRRRGEILNLTWPDVSADFQYITCRNTKNGSTISFPLNAKARAVIIEAQHLQIHHSELVFPSSTGHHYGSGFPQAWSRMKARLKRLNILDISSIRFHDLRHTYASLLASSGLVDIYTLKTLLGHKDIKLTERYSHLSDSRLRKSTEVLDTLL